jgi:hypothetical protein
MPRIAYNPYESETRLKSNASEGFYLRARRTCPGRAPWPTAKSLP